MPDPATLHLGWEEIGTWLDSGRRFEVLGLDNGEGVDGADARAGRVVSAGPTVSRSVGLIGSRPFERVAPRATPSSSWPPLPGRAERITELLSEYDLAAVSVDRE